MLIYVTQARDTLYTIARRYNISLEDILDLNGLPETSHLVIGQAILLPGPLPSALQYTPVTGDTLYTLAQLFNTSIKAILRENVIPSPNSIQSGIPISIPGWLQIPYIIRPGDTLYSIATEFATPFYLLIRVNHILVPGAILPGQLITIPLRPWQTSRRPGTTIGYFQLTNLSGLSRTMTQIARYLTYGALFQFPIRPDGSITLPDNTEEAVGILKSSNVTPLMVITNWGPRGFDSILARAVLRNYAVKAKIISTLSGLLKRFGFAGVDIDFENMFAEDRFIYNDFIRDLVNALRPQGFRVIVTVAPKFSDLPTGSWVGAFDYAALGRLADLIFIMTYEWGWIGGPPMAIAPIPAIRRALAYAISKIPPHKIIQGVPFYGYNWPLPHRPERFALPVNLIEIYALAYHFQAPIHYDPVSKAPWFDYLDQANREHVVWFDDARSIEAKYRLNHIFNLGGLGWWSYDNEPYGFPQNWPLLNEKVVVSKLRIGG